MLIALWIVNGLLALLFLAAGTMKALRPKETIVASGLAWAESFSPVSIKLIGIAEVLGAIGLVLPLALSIAPILTPIAAGCLLITMITAVAVHVRRKETAVPAIVLTALTAVSTVLGFTVVL